MSDTDRCARAYCGEVFHHPIHDLTHVNEVSLTGKVGHVFVAPAPPEPETSELCAECGEDRNFWWHGRVHPYLERDAEKAHAFAPAPPAGEAPPLIHGVTWVLVRDGHVALERCEKKAAVLGVGEWFVPGGKLEPGEVAESALYRELSEEWPTMVLTRATPLPILEGSAVPAGPRGLFLMRPFLIEALGELPSVSGDGVPLRWVAIAEALASPVPQVRMMVAAAVCSSLSKPAAAPQEEAPRTEVPMLNTDDELAEHVPRVIAEMCSGDKWRMSIPVHRHDSDVLLAEMYQRFEALRSLLASKDAEIAALKEVEVAVRECIANDGSAGRFDVFALDEARKKLDTALDALSPSQTVTG